MATIKKISLNGVSYDLGGGLTEEVKRASLQIAEKVAYIDEHGQDYYDELYTAFYDNMWNVTNTLSNAVTSNSATKTLKDGTYTAIISAATGYTLDGATVSVTMNGANITSSAYNNGTISIPSVTGDVVITIVAVAVELVSISATYTQSGTVYDTDSLDSLKADLVVTATFNDSSTGVVPSADYTLTGTLEEGTSTITVTYEDKTTTFNVTVTAILYPLANGTYTTSNGEYVFTISNGNHVKCEVASDHTSTTAHFTMLNCYTGDYSVSNSNSINNKPTYFTIPDGKLVTLKLKNVVNSANGGSTNIQFIVLLRKANNTTSFLATAQDYHTTDVTVSETTSGATNIGAIGFGVNGFKYKQGAYVEFDVELTAGDDVYVGGH